MSLVWITVTVWLLLALVVSAGLARSVRLADRRTTLATARTAPTPAPQFPRTRARRTKRRAYTPGGAACRPAVVVPRSPHEDHREQSTPTAAAH